MKTESRLWLSGNTVLYNVNKNPTRCNSMHIYLFTAKSLYMFRVTKHTSSGVLKTVTAASVTGHNIGTANSLQRGQIGTSPDLFLRRQNTMLHCWLHGAQYHKMLIGMGITSCTLRKFIHMN